jgi:hypothetical protein
MCVTAEAPSKRSCRHAPSPPDPKEKRPHGQARRGERKFNMQSNYQPTPGDSQRLPRFTCIGCAADLAQPHAMTANTGPDGKRAPLCRACHTRGHESDVFAFVVNSALRAGATVPDVQGIFKRMGMQMPTSRAAALRLMRGAR